MSGARVFVYAAVGGEPFAVKVKLVMWGSLAWGAR